MTDRSTTVARRRLAAAVLAAGLLVTASCSSDGSDGDATKATSSTRAGATTTDASSGNEPDSLDKGHECDLGTSLDDVVTAPVPGVASDLTLTSFDDTAIRIHWFPAPSASAEEPAPTILMGPGWSLAGDTSMDGAPLFGALNISGMHAAGYNVLTWDPRGFGESEGEAQVNAADAEGRDAQALLDFVSEQPEAKVDAKGDPRVGMVGVSYGGGIQLTLSAIDCRVDAIVPNVAWHSLETALFKGRTVKAGWAGLLTNTAAGGSLDPHITSAATSGLATGTLSTDDEDWFRSRGPGDLVDDIDIPTLFVHGTVDTLFTLDEAITNYRSLHERDVPTAMLWYCGGHGTCLTDLGDEGRASKATQAWLDRYLKGDDTVKLGPAIDIIDQEGTRWTADEYPADDGPVLNAQASPTGDEASLALTAEGGAGPLPAEGGGTDVLSGLVKPITPAKATNAVELTAGPFDDALVVGAPELSFTYTGTAPDGPEPTRLFAQLVDDETGLVLGNQVTPIEVTLDGAEHTAEVPLEVVAHHLAAGKTLTLQLVATTVAYATPRLGGTVTVSEIHLTLPTPKGLTEG